MQDTNQCPVLSNHTFPHRKKQSLEKKEASSSKKTNRNSASSRRKTETDVSFNKFQRRPRKQYHSSSTLKDSHSISSKPTEMRIDKNVVSSISPRSRL